MWQGYQYNILQWCLCVLTVPFVLIRLLVHYRFQYRPWREVVLIMAWLLSLGNTITTSLVVDHDYFNPSVSLSSKSKNELATLAKINYANTFLHFNTVYCCKFVLLFFYNDLTPRYIFPKTWWCIAVTWVVVVASDVGCTGYGLFSCWPFDLHWSFIDYKCGNTNVYLIAVWAIHLATDIMIYTIPFLILHNLKDLNLHQKRAAYFMLGAGFVDITCRALCCILFATPGTATIPGINLAEVILAQVQSTMAIMVICLPQIRRFWKGTSPDVMAEERRKMRERHSAPQKSVAENPEAGNGSGGSGSGYGGGMTNKEIQTG